MMIKYPTLHALGLSCTVTPLVWLIFSLSQLPNEVPVHYGFSGIRYGGAASHVISFAVMIFCFIKSCHTEEELRLNNTEAVCFWRRNINLIPVVKIFIPCFCLFTIYEIMSRNYSLNLLILFFTVLTVTFFLTRYLLIPALFFHKGHDFEQ